jgi:hypothetical protein
VENDHADIFAIRLTHSTYSARGFRARGADFLKAAALRHAGIPAEEIETFCDEAMSGGDRELLRTCGRWVTLARH